MSGTLAMQPDVEVASATDPGKDPDKQVNEDTCRCGSTAFGYLAVLCDGMGGHEGGREASEAAVAAVFRSIAAAAPRPDIALPARAKEVLRDAVALANRDVYALGSVQTSTRPGSTLVAILLHAHGTEIAHIGDSRCYLVRSNEIRQLTRDHSMVQQLVDAGKLTPEEAARHPDANRITRALGMAASVHIEIQPTSFAHAAGDMFVLCSDGLSDLVMAPEIAHLASASAAEPAVHQLVDLANARGGHDNVTVVIVRPGRGAVPYEPGPNERGTAGIVNATEAMPVMAMPPGRAQPTLDWAPTPPLSDSHPLLPPAPPSRPRIVERGSRGPSAVVVIGLLLAVVGVGAVAAVVLHEFVPPPPTNDVPGLSLSIVLPAASLAPPGAPPLDDEGDAGNADGGGRARRFRNPRRK